MEVYEVDPTTMKFRVSDAAMRARILKRGMWNIGNIPLVVAKWTPKELEEKPEVKSIPLWVHLKNVPMNMFSWEGLSFITSAAGHPVKLHPETSACSNFKVAKIFTNVDLSKDLPRKINFTKNGKSSLVEFSYPWLPDRCNTCGKWGHIDKVCVMNKKEEFPKTVTEIIEAGYVGEKQSIINEETLERGEESQKRVEEVAGSAEGEKIIANETEIGVSDATKDVTAATVEITDTVEEEVEEGEVVMGWYELSPGKTSCSPVTTTQEYIQVVSPSRFSALNDADDNGDLVTTTEEISRAETPLENAVGKLGSEGNREERISENGATMEEGDTTLPVETAETEDQTDTMGTQTLAKGQNHKIGQDATKVGGSSLRPSLPRNSKTNHKVFSEQTNKEADPGTQGKRSRKSSQ